LDIDCETEEIKEKINILLVGIDLNISDYFILERLLDQESIREKIFKQYENFYKDLSGKAKSLYEHPDNIYQRYNDVVYKDGFRDKYKIAIITLLNKILQLNPDIIIFPE